MNQTFKFQARFEDIKPINSEFSYCKIYTLYTGINRNNSYLTKETVASSLDQLFNIPIIGEYLEDTNNFGGHGGKWEVETTDNGELSINYIVTTKAMGLVPESADVYWENVTEPDGSINEYLVIDKAILWTGRFKELDDLLNQKYGQSMEININSGEYIEVDGIKTYEIKSFSWSALCILGVEKDGVDKIEPCFESASIVGYSLDKDKFKAEFTEMLSEIRKTLFFNNVVETVTVNNPVEKWKCPHCKGFIGEKELYFNNEKWYHSPCIDKGEIQFNKKYLHDLDSSHAKELQKEGGNKIVPEDILVLLQKYSLTENDLAEKGISYSEFSKEDLEVKIKETFQTEAKVETEPSASFSLTSEQMENELRRELGGIETLIEVYYDEIYTYPRYYYKDHKPEEKIVIAMDEKNWYLVGFSYSVGGDAVKIDPTTLARFKADYIPMDLSGASEDRANEANPQPDDDMFAAFTSKAKSDFMLSAKEKSLTKQFESEKESIKTELNAQLSELQVKYTALEAKLISVDSELAAKLQVERESSESAIFQSFSKSLTDEEMKEVKDKKSQYSLQEIEDKLCVILGKKTIGAVSNFSLREETPKPLRYPIVNETEKPQSDKSYADLIKTKE